MGLAALFLIGSAALFLMLVFVALRSGDEELDMRPAFPSRDIMNRILAPEDVAFISSLHDRRIRVLFRQERRRLALAWVGQMRREARRVLQMHVQAARETGDLRPLSELRIASQFITFACVCTLMTMLLRVLGPFGARCAVRLVDLGIDALGALASRMAGMAQAVESGAGRA